MSSIKTWIIIPDTHVPFHDKAYIKIINHIITLLGKSLTGIVQLGDAVDWFQISAYDKDPARKNTAYDDLMEYSAILNVWENMMPPGSKFYQLEGNHEDRLRRFTWSKVPELNQMISTVPDMLFLKDRTKEGRVEFKWFPLNRWDACQIGDVALHHGFYYDKHTSVNNLTRYRHKLITGHTHRVQYVSNGTVWAASLGHGAVAEKISHSPAPNDHQQAFGILTLVNGVGSMEVVLVNDGRCLFRGEALNAKTQGR
jgi:hypothetical protein